MFIRKTMILLALATGLTACFESDLENAIEDTGERMEEAVENTNDKMEDITE